MIAEDAHDRSDMLATHQGCRANPSLYDFRNRCYSATLGRWVVHDPLGFIDGSNLYEYLRGSPIARLDPEGTNVVLLVACGACIQTLGAPASICGWGCVGSADWGVCFQACVQDAYGVEAVQLMQTVACACCLGKIAGLHKPGSKPPGFPMD